MTEPKPWEPVASWSPEQREAFVMYRDQGIDRSLRATQEALGKPSGYQRVLEEWSRVESWVGRVAAYDAELDRIRREASEDEIARITKTHAKALESAIKVISRPILELADKIERGEVDLTDDPYALGIGTKEGAKLLPALVQASRLVHGVSTQNVAVNAEHRHKIERASLDELDAYLLGHDDGAKQLAESVDRG